MPRSESHAFDSRRATDGPPLRPARLLLQLALVVELWALAFLTRGTPSGETWIWTWLLVLIVGLARSRGVDRQWPLTARSVVPALALAGLLFSPIWFAVGDARLALDPLWMAWVALPTVLLTDPRTFRATRLPSLPAWAGLVASLAIALWGSEPWHTVGERALLLIALATAFLITSQAQAEAVERRARSRGLPGPSSTVVPSALRALAFSSAMIAVFLTALLEVSLSGADAWLEEAMRPDVEPFEEMDTEASVARWPLISHDETILFHANVLSGGGNDLGTRPLYLREQVLSQYSVVDGVPYLVAPEGVRTEVEDGDDGREDGEIHWAGLEDWSGTPGQVFPTQVIEIAAVEPPSRRRLYEPRLVWMDADALTVDRDGTLRCEEATESYRVGSSPAEYFGWGVHSGRAADDDEHRWVPRGIRDFEWLESLAWSSVGGEDDDFRRAQRLAQSIFSTGVWESPPDWNDSYREFLEGSRTGLCIQFAQSAALLTRLIGLPSRIAVGFASREYLEETRAYVVRARNRHAWLEVHFEALGWVAFEVTPPRPADEGFDPTFWEEEVPAQAPIDEAIAESRPGLSWLGIAVAVAGAMVLLGSMLRRPGLEPEAALLAQRRSPEEGRAVWQALRDLEKACRRRGIHRSPSETVRHFVTGLVSRMPGQADELGFLLGSYHDCRFGSRELDDPSLQRIRGFLRQLPEHLKKAGETEPRASR